MTTPASRKSSDLACAGRGGEPVGERDDEAAVLVRPLDRSRQRGLLALYLFSDVDADGAPTRVRPGSGRDAARVLASAGDEGVPFPQAALLAAQASADRPTALATGRAGDVILCHPFLVHAASWPHAGRQPRIMAQPGVALHDAFPLVPAEPTRARHDR